MPAFLERDSMQEIDSVMFQRQLGFSDEFRAPGSGLPGARNPMFMHSQSMNPSALMALDPLLLGCSQEELGNFKRERALSEGENSSTSSSSNSSNKSQQAKQINSTRYKTELCRPYEENSFCKYGDKCQFAHGYDELRNLQRHPKYKTDFCRTFHTIGFCPYGPRCHFIHNENERQKTISMSQSTAAQNLVNQQVAAVQLLTIQRQQQAQVERMAAVLASNLAVLAQAQAVQASRSNPLMDQFASLNKNMQELTVNSTPQSMSPPPLSRSVSVPDDGSFTSSGDVSPFSSISPPLSARTSMHAQPNSAFPSSLSVVTKESQRKDSNSYPSSPRSISSGCGSSDSELSADGQRRLPVFTGLSFN